MGNSEESRLSAELAVQLRDAATRIRGLDVPDAVRADLLRALIAVTHAAKRDLAVAVRRFERLSIALDAATEPSRSLPER